MPRRRRFPDWVRRSVTSVFERPPFCRVLCWNALPGARSIALTFDDGPDPHYTEQVLACLRREGVRGTFFVLGRAVEANPRLFQQILDEGHEVGIHGYDHSTRDLPSQARRTLEIVAPLGIRPRLFRPPGGKLDLGTLVWMARGGLSTVLWSFDALDSMRHEGKVPARRPYEEIRSGDIVLMHDDNPVCVRELGEVISTARAKDLRPVVVSELLGVERAARVDGRRDVGGPTP